MSKRKIITVALLGLFICSMLILVPIQPVTQSQKETGTSTFVISSWEYPDEYGQGIYGYFLLENSSGAFWPVGGPLITYSSCNGSYTVNDGISYGFDVRVYVNYTLLGLEEPETYDPLSIEYHPALNYLRLNITVLSASETIFSQNNP